MLARIIEPGTLGWSKHLIPGQAHKTNPRVNACFDLVLSMLDNVVGLRLFSAVSGPNLRIPVQLVLLVIGVGSSLFWGMPLGFCNWLL